MKDARYILQPYMGMKTRYICPNCNDARKTFVRYIDSFTGKHIADDIGRCNREDKCGYHKPPGHETKCMFVPFEYIKDYSELAYQLKTLNGVHYLPKSQVLEVIEKGCYVSDWYIKNEKIKMTYVNTEYKYFVNGEASITPHALQTTCKEIKTASFIPIEVVEASLKGYEANNFVTYLKNLFGIEVTNQLIGKYFIATSKLWDGATVFWQIGITGKVSTGKIMLYDPNTGHRVKEPFNHISWAHKGLKLPEFELRQCLFGEHLLRDTLKPVALVESEKTAIIASVYLPKFTWLAVGGKQNLTCTMMQALKGRRVVLFPDLKGYEKWNAFAKEHSHLAKFTVSDFLERKASKEEKEQGLDLADYLVKFDYKEFGLPEHQRY
jgi:hypothetical protein